MMRMVRMTLDDELVEAVDEVVKDLKTTRSAFTCNALRDALERYHARRLEEQHRKGYARHPAGKDEFSVWAKEFKPCQRATSALR